MKKLLRFYGYFADKRYSTIGGTLAYFLLMSCAPFLFWITLILGKVDLSAFMSHEIFAAVQPIIDQLQKSAESAVGGAGIILLVTSLYSSTNFFYHLRRSGEIIYNAKSQKNGIKLRIATFAIILCSIIVFAVIGAVALFGSELLSLIMPQTLADCFSVISVTLTAFVVALLLNVFACPYKLKIGQALPGSFLTTLLWLVFAVGFSVYLRFANPTRLYGAIAAVIIFLLWCYVMVNCLVIGIIYNGLFLPTRRTKSSLF